MWRVDGLMGWIICYFFLGITPWEWIRHVFTIFWVMFLPCRFVILYLFYIFLSLFHHFSRNYLAFLGSFVCRLWFYWKVIVIPVSFFGHCRIWRVNGLGSYPKIAFLQPFRSFFPESVWAKGSSNSGGLLHLQSSSHLQIFSSSHLTSSDLLIFVQAL